MDFNHWKKEIFDSCKRDDEEQERKFLALVDSVENCCDYEIAKILMKTFLDRPDYGTQERVVSVLSSLSTEEYIRVVLEELPRLVKEAYEWAESLIAGELHNHFDFLCHEIKSSSPLIKNCLKQILKDPNFIEYNANALRKELRDILNK